MESVPLFALSDACEVEDRIVSYRRIESVFNNLRRSYVHHHRYETIALI